MNDALPEILIIYLIAFVLWLLPFIAILRLWHHVGHLRETLEEVSKKSLIELQKIAAEATITNGEIGHLNRLVSDQAKPQPKPPPKLDQPAR